MSLQVDWLDVVMALRHGIVVLDPQGRVAACNDAAERLLDRPAGDLHGRSAAELGLEVQGEDDGLPEPWPAPDGAERVVGLRDGEDVRWLATSAVPSGRSVVVTLTDVSEARERELRLRRLSQLDDLTGLPNRRRFLELLDRHLVSQRREDAGGAVLLIDLDRFKELNDSFGHAAGDRVLVQVARAIRDRLREDDVLARLGGDEFAVLLRRATARDAEEVAQALIDRLHREPAPAPHGGTQPIAASIGAVALAGTATGTAERALARADASMYRAKADGRAVWRVDRGDAPGVGEQLAKLTRQLALANAVGARLAGLTDVTEIAEATVEELRRAFGYHLTAVIRLRDAATVEAVAVRGAVFDALQMRGWSQPADAGMIGRCLRERTPILINDVRTEPGYEGTPETADVCAELCAPLLVNGRVWGALNIEELQPDAFDHDDVILLSTLANQVGAALHAADLLERLRQAESRSGPAPG